ncbi:MAG: redoxin domain-containing protein [Verrucomicrobiales bacterium]|nr:redoxin domain-containing protein [Verrucomicrobiales bacterium]
MNTWLRRVSRLVAAVLFLTLLTDQARAATPKVGETFPDLSAMGLEGALPELKGKVVLVDFFASWCGPCQESFPVMQELHEKFGARGLVVVAVNEDQKKEDMELFLKKHTAGFIIVRDAGNRLVSQVKIPTMPTSFLIDREGKVHAVHRGFKGAETKRKYLEEIEALLK